MINVVATHASQVTPSNCFYGISPVPQHMGKKKKKEKEWSLIFFVFSTGKIKIGLVLESSLVLVVVWPFPMCVFPTILKEVKRKLC